MLKNHKNTKNVFLGLQEEDFTGFGSSRTRPQRTSPASEGSSEAGQALLIGEITHKNPKADLIGTIVQRTHVQSQAITDSPVQEKEPASRQQVLKKDVDVGSVLSQVAVTSVSGAEPEKLLSAVAPGRGKRKTSKLKGQSEASEENTDQSEEPAKRVEGFRTGSVRRTSQAASLFFKSLQKRRRRRRVMVKSAAAEGGAPSGEDVAIVSEDRVPDAVPKKTRRRKGRRSLFGRQPKTHKRGAAINHPKGHTRMKRVYYTYVTEPNVSSESVAENQQQQRENVTPVAAELSPFCELVEQSSNSPAATPSGRASRVIKVPKRFLDEEILPFPKGSLSTRLKSHVKEEEKPGPSSHEPEHFDCAPRSKSDSFCAASEGDPAAKRLSPKAGAGETSHVEIYKNLKRLTLKLAEKKRRQPDVQGSRPDGGNGLGAAHTKRRRRSTLTMEELDSPGVVRKLAVVVNASAVPPAPVVPGEETEKKSKRNISTFLSTLFFLCCHCFFLYFAKIIVIHVNYIVIINIICMKQRINLKCALKPVTASCLLFQQLCSILSAMLICSPFR